MTTDRLTAFRKLVDETERIYTSQEFWETIGHLLAERYHVRTLMITPTPPTRKGFGFIIVQHPQYPRLAVEISYARYYRDNEMVVRGL